MVASGSTGTASITTDTVPVDDHVISASYSGDPKFIASATQSPQFVQTVNGPRTTSTAALVGSPSPSLSAQNVVFTATITGPTPTPVPRGSVTFYEVGAMGARTTLAGPTTLDGTGKASFAKANFSIGAHNVLVVYGGDVAYRPSSRQIVHTVLRPSSTALTVSPTTAAVGDEITMTATVGAAPDTATGEVTFKNGAATLGVVTLDASGVATFRTSSLVAGTYSVTAAYAGDTKVAPSTSSATTLVVKRASATTVSVAPPSSTQGDAVVVAAEVKPSDMAAGVPTGSVQFRDGGVVFATVALDGAGRAQTTTTDRSTGSHLLSAFYIGDANFKESTSGNATLSVKPASTTTLTSSKNPASASAMPADQVTFTATVAAPVAIPDGTTITFFDGVAILGTGLTTGGVATYATNALTQGAHAITARFPGTASVGASTSAVLTQRIQRDTTTTVTSSNHPADPNTPITFTATVVQSGGPVPTGNVTFKANTATILGTVALNASGVASYTVPANQVGTGTFPAGSTRSIVADYAGDAASASSMGVLDPEQRVRRPSTTALAVSPGSGSATESATVTMTATVAAGAANVGGRVTFLDGTEVLGSAPITGSGPYTAVFSTTSLAGGTHSLTARYDGDSSTVGSTSAAASYTLFPATTGKRAAKVALASSKNPSNRNEVVTFTATVTSSSGGGGTPTGTVAFKDGPTTLDTLPLDGTGKAAFSYGGLAGGSRRLTAVYSGNATFETATSPDLVQTVRRSVTLTVTATPNPVGQGQQVTLTAVANAGLNSANPTGLVTFLDNGITIGTATLRSGSASLVTTFNAGGVHPITATYPGDSGSAPASSVVTNVSVTRGSTTGLASSINPSDPGQSVTFTAQVTPASGGAATGNVVFTDGGTVIGTVALDGSGVATLSTAALTTGSHAITATYPGDASTSTSSASLTQVVRRASSTSLTSSPNPSQDGMTVMLTATVTPNPSGAPAPSGTVDFYDGATKIASSALSGPGVATVSVSTLSVGNHVLTARYLGDTGTAASTSGDLNQLVIGRSTTSLTSSANPSNPGQGVTFTATVTSTGPAPTGTVTFTIDGGNAGTVAVAGGVAMLEAPSLASGSHSVVASYSGDASTGSSSAMSSQVVRRSSTVTLGSSDNPSGDGQSVVFTATVSATGATPTGSVTFADGGTPIGSALVDGSGGATISTNSLTPGTHAITAVYGGDDATAGSSSNTVSQTVKARAAISLSSDLNPSNPARR